MSSRRDAVAFIISARQSRLYTPGKARMPSVRSATSTVNRIQTSSIKRVARLLQIHPKSSILYVRI